MAQLMTWIEGFSVVFLSIFIEALPFVMLGALAASLIEVFVTPQWLLKHIPRSPWLAYPLVAIMGLIFPICECAIVPIMRKLIAKGTPVGLAITFMLSVPIVNPVVLMSTAYAFPDSNMMWLRGGGGFIGAIAIGLIFHHMKSSQVLIQKPLKDAMPQRAKKIVGLAPRKLAHNVIVSQSVSAPISAPGSTLSHVGPLTFWKSKSISILNHTQHELFDVGRYLILGAFVSASMQVFVPRGWLLSLGENPVLSTLAMMTLAFVLSLCSEADAFVASTFRYQFSEASLFAFLVFGPMIDIKNTLMLAGSTQRSFVIKLIATIALVCLIMALVVAFGGVVISSISII